MPTIEEVFNKLRGYTNLMLVETGIDKNNPLFVENMKMVAQFLKGYSEPRTILGYGHVLTKHLIPFTIKINKRISELSEQDLAILYDSIEKNKTLTLKASIACVNKYRVMLGRAKLSLSRIRYYNPKVCLSTQAKFYVDLTPEEIERIEANADSLEMALMIEVMAYSGLRPAEALGLRWEDISFMEKEGIQMILANIVHRPGDYGAKGKKGERVVPLSPRAVSLIKRIMAEHGIEDTHDPQVAQERIIPLEYPSMVKQFKAAVSRAAIPKRNYPITPHKLRHYFAIHYLKLGGSPAELMQLMKINIQILQIYIQISGRAVEDAYFNKFYREVLEKKKYKKPTI
ncbi:MAG: tyrosine-type recombinase/integrase [Nitrososphaeria archaeon]